MHIFGEMTQIIINVTVCFLIYQWSRGRVEALVVSGQCLELVSPLQPLFLRLLWSGLVPGQGEGFSQKVRAGNGTVCPRPTLNLISAGAPELEAPRSFPKHQGIKGLSCRLAQALPLASDTDALLRDLKIYETTGNFSVSTWRPGTPTLPGCLPGAATHPFNYPPPPGLRLVLSPQSFRTRAHPLSDVRACALRSPEIRRSAVLPTQDTKALHLGAQDSSPPGSRVGAPGRSSVAASSGKQGKLQQTRAAGCASPDRD